MISPFMFSRSRSIAVSAGYCPSVSIRRPTVMLLSALSFVFICVSMVFMFILLGSGVPSSRVLADLLLALARGGPQPSPTRLVAAHCAHLTRSAIQPDLRARAADAEPTLSGRAHSPGRWFNDLVRDHDVAALGVGQGHHAL